MTIAVTLLRASAVRTARSTAWRAATGEEIVVR
jgi:hypothetical protein